AYLITFGGFLLLGGRLGDLFGHRRLFLIGLTVFTLASLACGLAGSQTFLVVARAVQGLGGAVVSVVALSLTMIMFTEPAERAIGYGHQAGWTSGQTLGLLAAAAALLAVFLGIEARARAPLVPLGLFRLRNVSTANGVAILMAGGMFATFFLSALYLQQVLGYT